MSRKLSDEEKALLRALVNQRSYKSKPGSETSKRLQPLVDKGYVFKDGDIYTVRPGYAKQYNRTKACYVKRKYTK